MTVEEFYKELKEEINEYLRMKGLSRCFEAGGQFRNKPKNKNEESTEPSLTIQKRRSSAQCSKFTIIKQSVQLAGKIEELKYFKDIKSRQKTTPVSKILGSEDEVSDLLDKAKEQLHTILEDAIEKNPFWK